MKMSDKMLRTLQRALRFNMFLGLTVTVVATYMIVTGTYDSIQSRTSEETLLSWIAIIGLLYTFGFWIACVFRRQFFQGTPEQEQ